MGSPRVVHGGGGEEREIQDELDTGRTTTLLQFSNPESISIRGFHMYYTYTHPGSLFLIIEGILH